MKRISKNKICIFVELWESGGIESFFSEVLKSSMLSDLCFTVVAPKIKAGIFQPHLEAIGVKFIELTGNIRSVENYRKFKNLLVQEGFDAIHLNIFHGFALRYAKIANKAGIRIIISHAHNSGLRKSILRPLKLTLHRIGRWLWQAYATDFLACSSSAARFVFGKEADEIVKNCIDTEKFDFSEKKRIKTRKTLSLSDYHVIGHVGRMSEEKNHEFLLKTFSRLLKIRKDSKLLLIGDGPLRKRLQLISEKLGISDRVIFFGATNDVATLLCAMDVFVFPSVTEGFGIAAIEAQCAALPVLCSEAIPQSAYLTEFIHKMSLSCGETAWANEISHILDSFKKRIPQGEKIRRAGYSRDFAAKQLLKYYTKH